MTAFTSERVRRAGIRRQPLVLALVLTTSAALLSSPRSATAAASFERVAGSDRFATAAAVSERSFEPGASAVFIATGFDFPDALAAAPAAAAANGPLLLVTPQEVPPATAAELERLQSKRIVVVGNPAAVSEQVMTELRSHTRGGVTRLAGADQFDTAAAVASASFQPGVGTVFIANGRNFPDGLGGGAAAGALGGPVLFTEPDRLPSATASALNRLRPTTIMVLGGPAAVSSAVESQLARYGSVRRQAGPNRFTTSAAIAAAAFPQPVSTVYLATGGAFPDALAGGPAAAAAGGPLLLTPRDCIPAAIDAQLDRLNPETVVVLGGKAAIGEGVLSRTPCQEPVTVLSQDLHSTSDRCDESYENHETGSGRINGQYFSPMIWCTLYSEDNGALEYDLGRRYGAFHVTIGQSDDSESTGETVEWRILVDGVLVASRELGFGKAEVLRIGVPNALRLRLEVAATSEFEQWNADVGAAWGEPRLLP